MKVTRCSTRKRSGKAPAPQADHPPDGAPGTMKVTPLSTRKRSYKASVVQADQPPNGTAQGTRVTCSSTRKRCREANSASPVRKSWRSTLRAAATPGGSLFDRLCDDVLLRVLLPLQWAWFFQTGAHVCRRWRSLTRSDSIWRRITVTGQTPIPRVLEHVPNGVLEDVTVRIRKSVKHELNDLAGLGRFSSSIKSLHIDHGKATSVMMSFWACITVVPELVNLISLKVTLFQRPLGVGAPPVSYGLGTLSRLETLDLTAWPTDAPNLRQLHDSLPRLKNLAVLPECLNTMFAENIQIENMSENLREVLDTLTHWSGLESLQLITHDVDRPTPVLATALTPLSQFSELRDLSLAIALSAPPNRRAAITGAEVAKFTQLRALQLTFHGPVVDLTLLRRLQSLRQLKLTVIKADRVTGLIPGLCKLDLQHLDLFFQDTCESSQSRLNEDVYHMIPKLPNSVRTLRLGLSHVLDPVEIHSMTVALAKRRSLRKLTLVLHKFQLGQSSTFAKLTQMTWLEELALEGQPSSMPVVRCASDKEMAYWLSARMPNTVTRVRSTDYERHDSDESSDDEDDDGDVWDDDEEEPFNQRQGGKRRTSQRRTGQ